MEGHRGQRDVDHTSHTSRGKNTKVPARTGPRGELNPPRCTHSCPQVCPLAPAQVCPGVRAHKRTLLPEGPAWRSPGD